MPGRPRPADRDDDRLGQPVTTYVSLRTRAELRQLIPSRVTAAVRYAFGSVIVVPAWRARVRPRNASCTTSSAEPTEPVIP